MITALAIPLLALETGSYDVRFGGPDVIRDRYLFYLAPLLLLATAVCLLQERLPLVGIAAVTVVFAATAVFGDFAPVAGLWVDSPQSVLNGLIHDQSGGLPAGVFVSALRPRARPDLPGPGAGAAAGCRSPVSPWPSSASAGRWPATPSTGC